MQCNAHVCESLLLRDAYWNQCNEGRCLASPTDCFTTEHKRLASMQAEDILPMPTLHGKQACMASLHVQQLLAIVTCIGSLRLYVPS